MFEGFNKELKSYIKLICLVKSPRLDLEEVFKV